MKELWLLRQQRGFLTWGAQQRQKQELLRRSWKRISWKYGLIATPFVLLLGFRGWSYTPPGQIQWARWNLVIMDKMIAATGLGGFSGDPRDLVSASNLDMVSGVKDNPFPTLWLDWFATEYYDAEELSRVVKLTSQMKDRESAKRLLHQVEVVVGNNKRPSTTAQVLIALSQTWVTWGETQKAQQNLFQALKSLESKSIDEASDEAGSPLVEIAKASSKLGDNEKGKQILAQALEVVNFIKNESSQASSLNTIAEAYSKLGDREKGKQILAQALIIANSVEIYYLKVSSLNTIAEAYSKLGDREKAKQVLSQALEIANSVKEESSKTESLKVIAQEYNKLGDSEKGKQVLLQALETANSIKNELIKAKFLGAIAQASSKLGDSEKGKQILAQALEIANLMKNESSKADSLIAIAQSYLDLGDRPQAKVLLDNAANIINIDQNNILDPSELALLYAEFGNWGEALRLAQRCYGNDRVRVFARTLRVHAEQQQPEFKALRDWQEEERGIAALL